MRNVTASIAALAFVFASVVTAFAETPATSGAVKATPATPATPMTKTPVSATTPGTAGTPTTPATPAVADAKGCPAVTKQLTRLDEEVGKLDAKVKEHNTPDVNKHFAEFKDLIMKGHNAVKAGHCDEAIKLARDARAERVQLHRAMMADKPSGAKADGTATPKTPDATK